MSAIEFAGPDNPSEADSSPCWRNRLVHRKHAAVRSAGKAPDLSIWLEHAGRGAYFPLGTRLPHLAAKRAAAIDRALRAEGWPAVLARCPREITLAVFWTHQPAACTYTTLLTAPRGSTPPRSVVGTRRQSRVAIGILEADDVVRDTLGRWVAGIPSCSPAIVTGDARELFASEALRRCDLVFHNRFAAAPGSMTLADRLRQSAPRLPVFEYGIFDHSDAIFQSLTGVDLGYFLRRRPPESLLEPIAPQRWVKPGAAHQLTRQIQSYFQGLFREGTSETAGAAGPVLTARENQILECIRSGCHDKQIAGILCIQPSTVHTHLKKIFHKLGVRTRTEAVLRYLEK